MSNYASINCLLFFFRKKNISFVIPMFFLFNNKFLLLNNYCEKIKHFDIPIILILLHTNWIHLKLSCFNTTHRHPWLDLSLMPLIYNISPVPLVTFFVHVQTTLIDFWSSFSQLVLQLTFLLYNHSISYFILCGLTSILTCSFMLPPPFSRVPLHPNIHYHIV